MMEELKNFACGLLSILALIQFGVFILSASDGRSTFRSYIAAWAKTLRVVSFFFAPGNTTAERKAFVAVWGVVALCVPGAILVGTVVGHMVH